MMVCAYAFICLMKAGMNIVLSPGDQVMCVNGESDP